MSFKQRLAAQIVERFHGGAGADRAAEHFAKVVQRKEIPDGIPDVRIAAENGELGLLSCLVRAKLAPSNSEARRLVVQGAVQIDGEKVSDASLHLAAGGPYLLKVGKRRYARVVVG